MECCGHWLPFAAFERAGELNKAKVGERASNEQINYLFVNEWAREPRQQQPQNKQRHQSIHKSINWFDEIDLVCLFCWFALPHPIKLTSSIQFLLKRNWLMVSWLAVGLALPAAASCPFSNSISSFNSINQKNFDWLLKKKIDLLHLLV